MDPDRFDALSRSLTVPGSRQRALTVLSRRTRMCSGCVLTRGRRGQEEEVLPALQEAEKGPVPGQEAGRDGVPGRDLSGWALRPRLPPGDRGLRQWLCESLSRHHRPEPADLRLLPRSRSNSGHDVLPVQQVLRGDCGCALMACQCVGYLPGHACDFAAQCQSGACTGGLCA